MPRLTIIAGIADYRKDPTAHLKSLGEELDGIQDALRPAVEAGLCELELIADLTAEKLVRAVERANSPVVGFHFAGHSTEQALILRENATREGLAAYLGRNPNLIFTFLNGCSSAGHVRSLHKAGIPTVIATDNAVPDTIARDVAVSFYTQLAQGRSLHDAFEYYNLPANIKQKVPSRQLDLGSAGQGMSWGIYYQEGAAPKMKQWSLPVAAEQPLYGLPEINERFDLPAAPFRYLHRYERQHTPVFFGRGKEIRELFGALTSRTNSPIILLCGQSGVGKSSLLEAGLFPRLEQICHIHYLRRTRQESLPDTLRQLSLQTAGTGELPGRDWWQKCEKQAGKPVVIVLDQVEEMFTRPGPLGALKELETIIDWLRHTFKDTAERPEGKVLLSFRQDYYADIVEPFQDNRLPFSTQFLKPLGKAGIKEAVAGLALTERLKRHYQLNIEDGLPGMIADDLLGHKDSPIAPMLQVSLTEMWNRCPPDKRAFSESLYRQVKREGIQVSDFVHQKMAEAGKAYPQAQQNGLMLDVLRFFTTPLGTAEQRSLQAIKAEYNDKADQALALTEALADVYLLSKSTAENSEPLYRLSHDTIAPVIRRDYEQSALPGPLAARIIGSNSLTEQPTLNAQQLGLVLAGQGGMRSWTEDEKAWIGRSRAAVVKERRQKKRVRIGFSLAGLALIAILAWGLQNARKQQRLSESQALASQAELVMESSPRQALRLLQQSLALQPNEQREMKLLQLLAEQPMPDSLFITPAPPVLARISRDGRSLIFTTDDADATDRFHWYSISEPPGGARKMEDPNTNSSLFDIAFGPKGYRAYGAGKSHQIHEWDTNGKSIRTRQYTNPSMTFYQLAPHPDGRTVAALTEIADKWYVQFWEVSNDRLVDSFRLNKKAQVLRYLPAGNKLLTGTTDGEVQLMDQAGNVLSRWASGRGDISLMEVLEDGHVTVAAGKEAYLLEVRQNQFQLLRSFTHPYGDIRQIDFAPHSSLFLTAGEEGKVIIWGQNKQQRLFELSTHQGSVITACFHQDGNAVLTLDEKGNFRTFPLRGILPKKTIAPMYAVRQLQAERTADGLRILAAARDVAIMEWRLPQGKESRIYDEHEESVTAFVRSGTYTISGDQMGNLFFRTEGSQKPTVVSAHAEAVTALAISPDEQLLASVSSDKSVYIWNPKNGQLLDSIPQSSFTRSLAFSPDGNSVWTIAQDGSLRQWSTQNFELTREISLEEGWSASRMLVSQRTGQLLVFFTRGTQCRFVVFDQKGTVIREIPFSYGCPRTLAERKGGEAASFALGMENGLVLLANEKGFIYFKLQMTDGGNISALDWIDAELVTAVSAGPVLLWDAPDVNALLQK